MTSAHKKMIWDANGGQVEVNAETFLIVQHVERIRGDIGSVKEDISDINKQIKTLGEQMSVVRAETNENTFFRKLVVRGFVTLTVVVGIGYLWSAFFGKSGG